MKTTVKYSIQQLNTTARLVYKYNRPFVEYRKCLSVFDVKKHILAHIEDTFDNRRTEKLPSWTATGGWCLIIKKEMEDYYFVEIFFDAALIAEMEEGRMSPETAYGTLHRGQEESEPEWDGAA
jgi:hypothetical protein